METSNGICIIEIIMPVKKVLKLLIVLILVVSWIFSGWPQIWHDPDIPPQSKTAHAANTPGDYLIRRNNAETTTITTGGTDIGWDTEVASKGTSITYSSGTFTLAAGKYLVSWGERLDADTITNNQRKGILARLKIAGTATTTAIGSGYSRQNNNSEETFPSGIGIIEIGSDSTALVTNIQRIDGGTTGNINRVAGYGGISILALDDTHLYARYRLNASQAIGNEPGSLDVVWDVNDEQDTGFSRTNDAITIPATAGRYFVSYSAHVNIAATTNRNTFSARLSVGGTNEPGTYTSTYCRGRNAPESILDCALQWGGLVDLSASEVLRLSVTHDDGGTDTANLESGTSIEIWQLPAGAETIIVRATTGEMAPATQADFAWDTLGPIDTAAFTHTAGNTNIDVDIADDYFFFASQYANVSGGTRVLAWGRFTVQNTLQTHVVGGSYNRGTTQSIIGGYAIGALLTGLNVNDSVELANLSVGQTATINNAEGSFTAFRLGSVFAAPPTLTAIISTDTFPTVAPGGTAVFATSTIDVDTNSASGWNVALHGDDQSDSDTVMDLTTNASVGITDQTEWIPGAATTTAGNAVRISSFDSSGDVLAVRVMTASGTQSFIADDWWGTADDYADNVNTLWAGIASTTASDKTIGNSSDDSGGGSVLSTVLYYLEVPSTQQSGDYSGNLTFTTTVNP